MDLRYAGRQSGRAAESVSLHQRFAHGVVQLFCLLGMPELQHDASFAGVVQYGNAKPAVAALAV